MRVPLDKPSTWIKFLLYVLPIGLAILAPPGHPLREKAYYIAAILLAFVLHLVNEALWIESLDKSRQATDLQAVLENVEFIGVLLPEGKIRASLFVLDREGSNHVVRQSYNMERFQDQTIRIPRHLGCTGESWLHKRQVFCNDKRQFLDGTKGITPEEAKKVWKDLAWICTTPILSKKNEVMAVLAIDGNHDLTSDQIEMTKQFGTKAAQVCKRILDGK